MEIAFGLIVLALLALGLMRRKKETKVWKAEERYEESGQWIDKRPGERGAYGSLDDEMEANRLYIAQQGKIAELAELAQNFCFSNLEKYSELSDAALKKHREICKSGARVLLEYANRLQKEPENPIAETDPENSGHGSTLRKQTLGYLYEHYPRLLELDLEKIRQLDHAAGVFSHRVLTSVLTISAD